MSALIMKNRWLNFALTGLVPVAMGGVAIQLGLFEPRDLRTVVGQTPSAAVASIRADTDYKYDIRRKDGNVVFVAVGTQLKYRFNGDEYHAAAASRDRGNLAEAEKLLRDILLRTPDESAALAALGTILFVQGRYREAESMYRSLQSQDPHSFVGLAGLGAVDETTGRYQDAIRDLSLAIQNNPTFALSYSWRSRAYLKIGQIAQAKADLERVVELLPPEAQDAVKARDTLASLNQAGVKPMSPARNGRGSDRVN